MTYPSTPSIRKSLIRAEMPPSLSLTRDDENHIFTKTWSGTDSPIHLRRGFQLCYGCGRARDRRTSSLASKQLPWFSSPTRYRNYGDRGLGLVDSYDAHSH